MGGESSLTQNNQKKGKLEIAIFSPQRIKNLLRQNFYLDLKLFCSSTHSDKTTIMPLFGTTVAKEHKLQPENPKAQNGKTTL